MGLQVQFFAAVLALIIGTVRSASHGTALSCPEGWRYLGGDKCYKVFTGHGERTWLRADAICRSYGSVLATFKDQIENNLIGEYVNEGVTNIDDYKSYWIGVRCIEDNCDPSGAFDSYGNVVSENLGVWGDGQPNYAIGQCVYTKKNAEKEEKYDYVYDRSYVQAMDHCSVKRSFVCERMAAPSHDTFHCFSGHFVDISNVCDGKRDCADASDELDCPQYCHYYIKQSSGQISLPVNQQQGNYASSLTCTWAIETPLGTNVFINFTSFDTEQGEDFVQVSVDSLVEVHARPVVTLSGEVTGEDKTEFRSSNNMMFVKFSSDSQYTRPGFNAVFGSVGTQMAYETSRLTAFSTAQTHSTTLHKVGGVNAFVAMTDYVYVISANDPYQIVTVEVLDDIKLGEDDKIVFYNGDSPHEKELIILCNTCPKHHVISSTGKHLSIHMMIEKPEETMFRFRYKQGCDVRFTGSYGTLFTPGYMGGIDYPSNIICTWIIDVDEPISIYFEQHDLALDDSFTCITSSNDYLQIYEGVNEAGTKVHTGDDGFGSADLRGTTFQAMSGKLFLRFVSTSTRAARGFKAMWSKDCEDPAYDTQAITITVNGGNVLSAPFHYRAAMSLSCNNGYSFQQQQIQSGLSTLSLTCDYEGKWNYGQIPRCTPNYCGNVPEISNGYIESSTGSVYGGVVIYRCYPGSNIIGNSQISCHSNGQWDPAPSCQTASCNLFLLDLNPSGGAGTIRAGTGDGTQIGSIVDYECDDGYEMDGDPIVICQDNGQWSANSPECKKKTCYLPSIPNGIVFTSIPNFLNFGEQVTVTCSSGYVYEDPTVTSITCQSDRSLTTLPVCVDDDECDNSPCQAHAHCRNTIGSFYCYCDPGFDLQPDGIRCQDRDECFLNEDTCDEGCQNIDGGYTCSCSLPKVLFNDTNGVSGYFIPDTENGLLPTDTYRLNQSCVLIACPPPPLVNNGVVRTQRLYHRYDDIIEYQCDLGYRPRTPSSTILRCNSNGQWDGSAPICDPVYCPQDSVGIFTNTATYPPGPYNLTEEITLSCSVAGQTFSRSRYCVYNRGTDTYELQGSPYDCGNINCGKPEDAAGSNYVVNDYTYGSSFVFTCAAGNSPTGTSATPGQPNTVTCQADGYWSFGSLQCFSQKCQDPGYPAGGRKIATSFADNSIVRFECTENGYTLSHNDPLVCQGMLWNNTATNLVPECIDTTPPTISIRTGQSCDGSYVITVQKYSRLSNYLPDILYSDNDRIESFTVTPDDANTTANIESATDVTWTAKDYTGNTRSCTVRFVIRDDDPPVVSCPSTQQAIVYLDDEQDVSNSDLLSQVSYTDASPVQTRLLLAPDNTITFADLYKTYTYTYEATDENGNRASCQGQVFISARSCTPNSYKTPLNAVKVCNPFGQGYRCTLTCDAGYHFEDDGGNGKQRTITCETNINNGEWNTPWIPACVRDQTPPDVVCPTSEIIYFTDESDESFVDYEALRYQASDLSGISSQVFQPTSHTFTPDDMYKAREIILTVTDNSGLSASCKFQYLVLPTICSPLSYPNVLYGSKSCSRNFSGYSCTVTCDESYVLQAHDSRTTQVDCFDGSGWDEVIPSCVPDNIDPTIDVCPASRTFDLETSEDFVEVTFGAPGYFAGGLTSDSGGIKNTFFLPPSENFTINDLNQVRQVEFVAEDYSNNRASCFFSVRVLPAVCSPLILPDPINGQKSCTRNVNGWSCDMTCDQGYGFTHTASPSVSMSCIRGSPWTGQVPGCSNLAQTEQTVYWGNYIYYYQPTTGISSVDPACGQHYLNQQSRNSISIDQTTKPLYEAMADRMKSGCALYTQLDPNAQLTITFLPEEFLFDVEVTGGLSRQVNITYSFTMTSLDVPSLENCKNWLTTTLPVVPSGYEFARDIAGDGGNCDTLQWEKMEDGLEGYRCLGNRFISPLDTNICRACPWGSVSSNGLTCNVCPVGTYHASPASTQCTSCGVGRSTRSAGQTSAAACVSECPVGQISDDGYFPYWSCPIGFYPTRTTTTECPAGQISEDGYFPCWSCPIGMYSTSTTTCVSCGAGKTTTSTGSSSSDACRDIVVQREPCGPGTQLVGNNCELCPEKTYRNLLLGQCKECDLAGTTTFGPGAVANSSCYGMCGGGLTSSDGKPPCTACPKGTYYYNSTYCADCPNGYTTEYVGSLNSNACRLTASIRVKCPRGTYRDGTSCTKCDIGFYSTGEDVIQCSACPNGYLTFQEGATSVTMCFKTCSPGFTSTTGMSPCTPCGKGFYSTSTTTCAQCDPDSTTKTDTAGSINECTPKCPAGYFSVSGYNHDNTCRACPANHYQDLIGQTFCRKCDTNRHTDGQTGVDNLNGCIEPAQTKLDLCLANDLRCQNRGSCSVYKHSYLCSCDSGYYGAVCSSTVNFCENNPCFNGGGCTSQLSGPVCNCGTFATGGLCENVVPTCTADYCQNGGHCMNLPGRSECLCTGGYTGATCLRQTGICDNNPCLNGICEDISNGQNLRRKCNCFAGYTGKLCDTEIDLCESSPCLYGTACTPSYNDYTCSCPLGYSGKNCQFRQRTCDRFNCFNGVCVDDYKTDEARCICSPEYYYGIVTQWELRLGTSGDPRPGSPTQVTSLSDCQDECSSDSFCTDFTFEPSTGNCYIWITSSSILVTQDLDGYNHYTKQRFEASDDYWTPWYDISSPSNANFNDDIELRVDLINSYSVNVCEGTEPIDVECRQVGTGFAPASGVSCTVDGLRCEGNTFCADYEVRYKCSTSRVFKNNQCLQRNNCNPNPCPSGTTCRSFGETYRCNCPPGFAGRNCQTNIDDCATSPCQNDAICTDLVQNYECNCTTAIGYVGRNCDVRMEHCSGVSCNFRGSCQNLLTDYVCRCNAGYEGKDCETEINRCQSNPCLHGSTCNPLFNSYRCTCPDGWTGTNCDEIVDRCLLGGNTACLADCYSTFNNYYCKCPAMTFGRNCQNQSEPCRTHDKCQNGGQCSYDPINNMMCTCDMRYTGDGCQILVDQCSENSNNCENGATCYVTQTGYGCHCPAGYTGRYCEQEIDECVGVPCPGGTCFDDIGTHYCRCPLGKTGGSCGRDYDPNYDIYFNHPKGLNYAWVPFPNDAVNADDMSISLWVRFAEAGSTGTFFTMFIGNRLGESFKFMEFRNDGVKVFISTDNGITDHTMLRFTYGYILNNGNWHFIVLNYNLAEGKMALIADSIRQTQVESIELQIADTTFKFWSVIGCEFNQVEHKCETGNRFHGFVSQVNFYSRQLDFNLDIPQIRLDPQKVFDPFSNVLLLWNEYLFETSDRIIPSEADERPCPGRCRTYSVLSRPTLSASNPCPDDIIVYSPDRLTTVTWDEPVFEGAVYLERPEYQSGASYHWGKYQITYVAVGTDDNKAVCSFSLYVQSSQCETPENPISGAQTCTVSTDGYKGCSLSCYNSNTNVIDRLAPRLFTCGPTGNWNVKKPFQPFHYPPCGEKDVLPPRAELKMKVVYKIITSFCRAAETNFLGRLREEFVKLDTQMGRELCAQADCSDLTLNITCGPAGDDTISIVDVVIPYCVLRTEIDQKDMLTSEFITCSVLGADILDFSDTIPGGNIDKATFLITTRLVCQQPNRVLINNECVECGAGTFYKEVDGGQAFCENCPVGTYQDQKGQDSCIPCNEGYTTQMSGSYEPSSCSVKCGKGSYSSSPGQCEPCPVGFYQDEEEQFYCKFCLRGQTTSDVGSTSSDQCQERCNSGFELRDNGCVQCDIGFYRDETESRLCVPCPGNKITQSKGAVSQALCTVEACEAGKKLNNVTNTCVECPIGYYQDQKWQTECKSCGDAANWRTDNEGSADKTDCKFYCAPGQEAHDAFNASPYCLACPIGSFKNNDNSYYDQCVPCAGNYRTEGTGSTSQLDCTIYMCPAGERPDSTNANCEKCPLGTYQPDQYMKDCINCSSGYSTRLEGSMTQQDCETFCPSGQEKRGPACVPCDRGEYKDNDDGLFGSCKPCPTNYTTAGSGTAMETGCSIRACPAGTKRNLQDTDCITCEMGTYQSLPYQSSCESCRSGTSTRGEGSTSPNDCELYCLSGTEKNATTGGCDVCDQGYYKDNTDGLFLPCRLCPIDKITAGTRSTSSNDCTIGNCTAGYKTNVNGECEICLKGTYQDKWWQTDCIECGTDKTTQFDGAEREELCILECPPGKEDINENCLECKRGFYKESNAAAACDRCPDGLTTELPGADAQSLCSVPACQAGTYLDRSGSVLMCKKCNYDTYQDQIWQEECKPCPDGKVTLDYGAERADQCVRNCTSGYEYNAARGNCDECQRGYYRNQFDRDQTTCQMCDINYITAGTKSESITDCNVRNCTAAGYFLNQFNQCELCPIATYLNMKWQTKCNDCPDGYSTVSRGSTEFADCRKTCPAGKYLGADNDCKDCAIGTYRTGLVGENCQNCPDRLDTPRPGAVSDAECTVSPCLKGQYYVRDQLTCKLCERGTYQNDTGKFQCITCPYAIRYTPAKGAIAEDDCRSPCGIGQQLNVQEDRCEACPEGYYQANERQFTCVACPDDKSYTAGQGSTSFQDCTNRCDAGNDCSVNATCSNDATANNGYSCTCFRNYDDVLGTGRECIHKCERGYCKNDAVCNRNENTRDAIVTCTCSEWYRGEFCETQVNAEELADKPLDIAIPVGISVGAFLLILGIIATACFVWSRRTPSPATRYSEFNGDRIEKTSMYSQGYGQTPYNQKIMLAPGSEVVFDNQAYVGPDAAVYTA